ncbi:MAG: hypothetical protein KGM17_14575 [Sphingomonadales bacterium]|nr:hypothetical protein [Sphingomonadales bacterium]
MGNDRTRGWLDTPLRSARSRCRRGIVLFAPDGTRLLLTREAALRSREALDRALAEPFEPPAAVVMLPRPRRPLHRLRQALRAAPSGCRLIVAMVLLPLLWVVASETLLGATLAALPVPQTRALAPWEALLGLALALPLAWRLAPLLLSPEERRPRPVRGRLRLV